MATNYPTIKVNTSNIQDHLRSAEKSFNAWLKFYKIPFTIKFEIPTKPGHAVTQAFENGNLFYENVICTICELLKVAMIDGKKTLLNGLCQSAKSPVQLAYAMLVGPAYKLLYNRDLLSISYMPNVDEVQGNQFFQKSREIAALLSLATLHYKGKSEKVDLYNSQIQTTIASRVKTSILMGDDLNIKAKKEMKNIIEESKNINNMVFMFNTRTEQVRSTTKYIIEEAIKQSMKVSVIRDEAHYGCHKNSTTDRAFEQSLENTANERERKLYDYVKSQDCLFVVTSATGFDWYQMEAQVKVRVTEKYTGIDRDPCRHGERFMNPDEPFGKSMKEIKVVSYTQLLKQHNIDLNIVNGVMFESKSSFDNPKSGKQKNIKRELKAKGIVDHSEYVAHVTNNLSTFFETYLGKGKKDAKGFLARFQNIDIANAICDELQIALKMSNIHIIRYYDVINSFDNVKEMIEIELKKHKKNLYVVVAVARARMGDSFPDHCLYGIDFAENHNNAQSMLQGIVGRMCGFKPVTTVFLNSAKVNLLQEYKDGKLNGSALSKNLEDMSPSAYFNLEPNDDPFVKSIINRLHLRMNLNRKTKGQYRAVGGLRAPTVWDILDVKTIQKLTKIYNKKTGKKNIPLLWSDDEIITDDRGFGYEKHPQGGPVISIRSVFNAQGDVEYNKGQRNQRRIDEAGNPILTEEKIFLRVHKPESVGVKTRSDEPLQIASISLRACLPKKTIGKVKAECVPGKIIQEDLYDDE